jgi:hypothetical protein
MLEPKFDIRRLFFDKAAVMTQMDTRVRVALGKFGALVRKSAIASVKEAPPSRHSSAGSPPFSHMAAKRRAINRRRKAEGRPKAKPGFKGLTHILFAYEPAKRSVIIGPASNRKRSLTIPEILEEGKLDVAERPLMGPAFERARERLDDFWGQSVK